VPVFKTKRRVPFTPDQMYAVAADVEHYPEFLPLCTGLTVLTRQPADGGGEDLTATMSVGYKAIKETFTTRVVLMPALNAIDVFYLDGPFKRLENRWRFLEAEGGSDIDFFIDYEFKSPMLGLLVGGMFDQAFRKFAEAFEGRARQVYGAADASQTRTT
jgi:coenzyme Q-binding protein COQ10